MSTTAYFCKKLYFGGLWIPLCVSDVYLMAEILRLGKSIDEEEKYMKSENCYYP